MIAAAQETLRRLAELVRGDPVAARAFAAESERQIRAWLAHHERFYCAALDPDLARLHTEHAALIHDGIAQVLGGVKSGLVQGPALLTWIDQEQQRLDRARHHATVPGATAPDGTVPGATAPDSDGEARSALRHVVEQFAARAMSVDLVAEDLGHEADRYGDELARILREALSNMSKHSGARTAVCTLRATADTLRMTVTGGSAPALDATPGTGLRTIERTARSIGARVEWIGRSSATPALHVTLPLRAAPRLAWPVSPEVEQRTTTHRSG
ncbi:MAG: hypothetical protein GX868_01920 [Actinobacteria bacterium]|nr:hypothetical protein [Actinomycetota bacterium]